MNIREFKKQSVCTSMHRDVLTANDFYFETFYYDVFTIIGSNLFIKEGIIKDSYANQRDCTQYFEGSKRISESQFKNRIKNLKS